MRVRDQNEEGIALCLAGGGYEAMLFHIGCLWRLNDSGLLPRVRQVSCVSGGAIVGGALALAWNALGFDDGGVARQFEQQVVHPIRRLAAETIDEWCILGGAFSPVSATDILADALDQYLYERHTLGDIPEERPEVPSFIFTACNLRSGALFSFSRSRVWDRRHGDIEAATLRLALVVTAVSAFVPMLSPVTLTFDASTAGGRRQEGQTGPGSYTAVLTNGAVLDPLGLEPVWKRSRDVLVCDGGGSVPDALPKSDWFQHTADVLTVMHQRARDAQRVELQRAMTSVDSAISRNVAYCAIDEGMGSDCPGELEQLSSRSSRLFGLTASRQEQLINLGYAACGSACRQWLRSETVAERAARPYSGVESSAMPQR